MYAAKIYGWDEVVVFSEDKEKAKRLAIKAKKARCKDDLKEWTWEECNDYYGASVVKIKEGMILDNPDDWNGEE